MAPQCHSLRRVSSGDCPNNDMLEQPFLMMAQVPRAQRGCMSAAICTELGGGWSLWMLTGLDSLTS